MTRTEAVKNAVERVDESGFMFEVLRRGSTYAVNFSAYGTRRGWKVVEMIGPGNVHNFREPIHVEPPQDDRGKQFQSMS